MSLKYEPSSEPLHIYVQRGGEGRPPRGLLTAGERKEARALTSGAACAEGGWVRDSGLEGKL